MVLAVCPFIFSCDSPQERTEATEVKTLRVKVETIEQEKEVQDQWADENGDSILLDGDIIFQVSESGQSKAIQLATHSKYSHVGMILNIDGKCYVYEAVQQVSLTPIEVFISRGNNKHFVVKRTRETDDVLSPDVVEKIKKEGMKYKGRDYDLYFAWSDDKLYCSELVYKLYKEYAGIEVGRLQKLKSFDLSSNIVKAKLNERYGDNIPFDENVVSPATIFDDPQLFTVMEQ